MKIRNTLLTALAILGLAMLTTPGLQAQTCDGTGSHFIDLDGDGFNDNAPDHDGDGIPNGLDEDWIKNAADGDGYRKGKLGENQGLGMSQTKAMAKTQTFNRLRAFEGYLFQQRVGALGGMNGMGAGICTGAGSTAGSGVCDGTGTGGSQNRGGK
ncbi:MAG: hypothetical protein KKA42_10380 [candidate division Zixibacteria bacterium]|nr:hypothetical protein [candidate division Zixibacteria bacterium]